jgi:hypothetical protein
VAGANDTFVNPNYDYPVRVESGSPLKGSASDGGDRGATIMYKRGVSGTLWGEPGYDELTDEPLWPFPYEDEIKKDMAAFNREFTVDSETYTINGARGFCAPGNGLNGEPITLTSYIWEYLGNPCPDEIYFGTVREKTPFESWASSQGLVGADALREADPDQDGINNLQEFAFGGNPLENDSPLIAPFFEKDTDSITYFYKKEVPELTYQVEHSSNLTDWFIVSSTEIFDATKDRYSKKYDIPPEESKVFLRLVIKED